MAKFTYKDAVKVRDDAPEHLRPGCVGSIYAVEDVQDRRGEFLRQYPHGVVYGVEFEDGTGMKIEEMWLEKGSYTTPDGT